MLKNKSKILAILLIIALLFSTSFVLADNEVAESTDTQVTENQNTVEPTEDNYKKHDVYLMGDNITVDYIVDGNLFVMAKSVTINSQIGGDAFIMAENITIGEQGYIFSNLFAMSQNLNIKGISYDVYATAKEVSISGGYIYRDLKVACNSLIVNGNVGRNAFVSCENIKFNNDGNTNGMIYGDLNISTNPDVKIPENYVSGKINYKEINIAEKTVKDAILGYIASLVKFIILVAIVWLLYLWLAPKFANKIYKSETTFVAAFGKGLLTVIAIPFAFLFAQPVFAIAVNNRLCPKFEINKNASKFGILVLTAIIIWLVKLIPFVGGIASFIMTMIGLGIFVNVVFTRKVTSDDKKEVVAKKVETKPEVKKAKAVVAETPAKKVEKAEKAEVKKSTTSAKTTKTTKVAETPKTSKTTTAKTPAKKATGTTASKKTTTSTKSTKTTPKK